MPDGRLRTAFDIGGQGAVYAPAGCDQERFDRFQQMRAARGVDCQRAGACRFLDPGRRLLAQSALLPVRVPGTAPALGDEGAYAAFREPDAGGAGTAGARPARLHGSGGALEQSADIIPEQPA